MSEPTLFEPEGHAHEPLASRLRPRSLEEFLGQEQLLGEGKPLREAIRSGEVGSMVFWGPPGSGKTTLARLIANYTDRQFEPFSAVTEGVPRVREIIREAEARRRYEGRGTILFCDEIHRFNRAQQDAFLPWVEQGTITLIGATTQNPSFELTGALLSRLQVFVLEPLNEENLREIVERGIRMWHAGRQGSAPPRGLATGAIELLVRHADGDARRILNAVEALLDHVTRQPGSSPSAVAPETVEAVLARRLPRYDKAGDEHYNLISAVHKAIRGSDVEGALYWIARMVSAGEDPLYLARRLIRIAVEDVGLADPRALSITIAAKEAYHFLGSPEGELAIAEAAVYLATAPKSNRVYQAWGRALEAAAEHPGEGVPMHIRNAPTSLMRRLGYGAGYRYDHAEDETFAAGQEYLPDVLRGVRWYDPADVGFEREVAKRLTWWATLKAQARSDKGEAEPLPHA